MSKQAANHLFTQTVYLGGNFCKGHFPIHRYHACNIVTSDGLKADHIIVLYNKTSEV
jgi:hypothetical protein